MHSLKEKNIRDLKTIILKDYGVSITEEQAYVLGLALLRLSRLALVGLARAKEKNSEN